MNQAEKPCLPGCVTTRGRGGDIVSHAPACPNSDPKPAEAQCECWKHEHQVCDICQGVEPCQPVSEPPIDWEGAKLSAEHGMRIPLNHLNNLGRAYLALKAEVTRLENLIVAKYNAVEEVKGGDLLARDRPETYSKLREAEEALTAEAHAIRARKESEARRG